MKVITKIVLFFISIVLFQIKATAQEAIKQETMKSAELHGRTTDSTSAVVQEPVKKQEPAKKQESGTKDASRSEAATTEKESSSTNKMAINEQGINKTKPKKKSSQKTEPETKPK